MARFDSVWTGLCELRDGPVGLRRAAIVSPGPARRRDCPERNAAGPARRPTGAPLPRLPSLLSLLALAAVVVTPCRAEVVRVDDGDGHSGDMGGVRAVWRANPYGVDTDGANVCFQTGLRPATDFLSVDELYRECQWLLPWATCQALRSRLVVASDIYIPAQNYTCCDGFDPQLDTSCNTPCSAGTYGPACALPCPCQNGGSCDPLTGDCTCPLGWTGQRCQRTCPEGSYGQDCRGTCRRCHIEGGTCDPVTGECLCHQHYAGDQCEVDCSGASSGTVGCPTAKGAFCDGCGQGSTCDLVLGACLCPPGWEGALCLHTCAEPWIQGALCRSRCRCDMAGSEACLPADGTCLCRSGWTGAQCGRQCPAGWYGPGCRLPCNCPTLDGCDPVSGRCNLCPIGWQGEMCTSPCESDLWGSGCGRDCNCADSDYCDPITGLCIHADDEDDGEFLPTTPWVASHRPLTTGHIAAIAGGAALVLLVLAIVVLLFVRRSRQNTPPVPQPAQSNANGLDPTTGTQRYSAGPSRNSIPPTPVPRDPSTFTTGPPSPEAGNHYEAVAASASSSAGNRRLRAQPHSYLELEEARPASIAGGGVAGVGGGPLGLAVAGAPPGADGYEVPTPQGTLDRAEATSAPGPGFHYAPLNAAERAPSPEYMCLQI